MLASSPSPFRARPDVRTTLAALSSAAVVAACGAGPAPVNPDAGSGPPSAARATLLPYVREGFVVSAAAGTREDGVLAALSPIDQDGEAIELLQVRGSEVRALPAIPLPSELRADCPATNPTRLRSVEAFGASPDGHGLLLARIGCKQTDKTGAVWFERTGGAFEWRKEIGDALPVSFRPGGIACVDGGECLFLFNRGLHPADPEGPSSVTVARFRGGRFVDLVLDEREDADDRLIEVRSIAASRDAAIVTAVEVTMPSEESGRAFVWRAAGTKRLDGASGYRAWTAATAAPGSSGFVLGGLKGDRTVDLLGVSLDGAVTVRGSGARLDDRTTPLVVAEADGKVLEVLEVGRADGPGWDVRLRLGGADLAFPKVSLGASVAGAIATGGDVIVYGDQTARGALANRHAPLLVRITSAAAPDSAPPLADAPGEPACRAPADCLALEWGVRCVGHFDCVATKCERTCDFQGCGDGRCAAEAGESAKSCAADCH